MNLQSYQCCKCLAIFCNSNYNWYAYYRKGKFHECPKCKSKLVPDYEFEKIGLLDKITNRLYALAFIACGISSYFWGYDNVGVIAFAIPAIAGGVTHVMYWLSFNDVEKVIQKTRYFEEGSK